MYSIYNRDAHYRHIFSMNNDFKWIEMKEKKTKNGAQRLDNSQMLVGTPNLNL